MTSNPTDLIERLRRGRLIRQGEPVTLIVDGKEISASTGDITQRVHPDALEAANALTQQAGEIEAAYRAGWHSGYSAGEQDGGIYSNGDVDADWKRRCAALSAIPVDGA